MTSTQVATTTAAASSSIQDRTSTITELQRLGALARSIEGTEGASDGTLQSNTDRLGTLWLGAADLLFRYPASLSSIQSSSMLSAHLGSDRDSLVAWAGVPDASVTVDEYEADLRAIQKTVGETRRDRVPSIVSIVSLVAVVAGLIAAFLMLQRELPRLRWTAFF